MRQLAILLFALLLAMPAAQSQTKNVVQKRDATDSLIKEVQHTLTATDSLVRDLKRTLQASDSLTRELLLAIAEDTDNPRYKIYKTDYFYVVLRLDSRTGQVSQVQLRTDSAPAGVRPLNGGGIVQESMGWDGRFDLFPINIYTFVMVDNYNGDLYQVQYGTDDSRRFVERITR